VVGPIIIGKEIFMLKINSPRFMLAPVSAVYGLETSVSRVDINVRPLGVGGEHKFTVVIQQNHVGGHTITGWPANLQFLGSPELSPEAGAKTRFEFFTQDRGANWLVECATPGQSFVTQGQLDTVVGDIEDALDAILQPEV
jgi:hypothetical protein